MRRLSGRSWPRKDAPSEVALRLGGRLEGVPVWGHPRTEINVVPPPSMPSGIGSLLSAIYNPNLVSDDTSNGLMQTEAAVVAMVSLFIGGKTRRGRPASSWRPRRTTTGVATSPRS